MLFDITLSIKLFMAAVFLIPMSLVIIAGAEALRGRYSALLIFVMLPIVSVICLLMNAGGIVVGLKELYVHSHIEIWDIVGITANSVEFAMVSYLLFFKTSFKGLAQL